MKRQGLPTTTGVRRRLNLNRDWRFVRADVAKVEPPKPRADVAVGPGNVRLVGSF